MLERLERADRHAELLARLQVRRACISKAGDIEPSISALSAAVARSSTALEHVRPFVERADHGRAVDLDAVEPDDRRGARVDQRLPRAR